MLSISFGKELKGGCAPAGGRSFRLEVDLSVPEGSFLGVLGPSGSGKTTLLRGLAGLYRPDSGFISLGIHSWYDSCAGVFVPPRQRPVGLVFQDYALFPNMTVYGNVQYATGDHARTNELLELVCMDTQAGHFPRELSGGQKQRTALARALGRKPALLLLDEPLSALDEELRLSLREELRRIQRETGVTAILVSHSRDDVFRLCDEVIELEGGRVRNRGQPGLPG
ncbi:MAG: ABC transporter ATP-binding protein [Spirochaetota bacterium]